MTVASPATFWESTLAELTRCLDASQSGLTSAEAAARRGRFGLNTLQQRRRLSVLRKLAGRFRNPLVLILLAAAGVSAMTGDLDSFAIIVTIVSLSVALDSIQEYRAEEAAERLKSSVALTEQVLRDGKEVTVRAEELVPGDVVLLAAGDLVPADGRVLEARDFFVNEALLTGEAFPIEKHANAGGVLGCQIQDAANAGFMGSSVVSDRRGYSSAPPGVTPSSARSAPRCGTRRRRPPSKKAPIASAC